MSDSTDPPNNIVSLTILKGGKPEPDDQEIADAKILAEFAEYYRMAKAGEIAEFAIIIVPKQAPRSPTMKWRPHPPSLSLCAATGALSTHFDGMLIPKT